MSAELSHGVSVVSHQVHTDMRGDFREWFSTRNLPDGWQSFTLAQANLSVSEKGVIRGIHFSRSDISQRKIVTCVRGEILDFVVDLRVGSPTFGSHVSIPLNADSGKSILDYLLGDLDTIDDNRGIFLNKTYRLDPKINNFRVFF